MYNWKPGRTRAMRIVDHDADTEDIMSFDTFRTEFKERAMSSDGGQHLTEGGLTDCWPYHGQDEELLRTTVQKVLKSMSLRGQQSVSMTEWIHYWSLERDGASHAASSEVNERLRAALQVDHQILDRMQMHFEIAAMPVAGSKDALALSSDGFLKVCRRLVKSQQATMEQKWADEVLQQHSSGANVLEEDDVLNYSDFLNVMLGRKRFKVHVWMYDISNGAAEKWSWLILGQEFKGFWHTGVVIEWPDESSEIWFGGKIFVSTPGTTPFGQPIEKRFMGYTFKNKTDVISYISQHLCPEFTKERYDVITRNCNHFSDTLSMHLLNEHLPDEILQQPEMIMQTAAVQALKPLLNRWLGGFGTNDGHGQGDRNGNGAKFGCEAEMVLLASLGPCALIEFATQEGGRLQIGRVEEVTQDDCVVTSLDFWRGCDVERTVPKSHIAKVLQAGLQKARGFPASDSLFRSTTTALLEQHRCCDSWPSILPTLLMPFHPAPAVVSEPAKNMIADEGSSYSCTLDL
eukprot:TRINITY_DN10946_c0_g1_i3.p1 TRINITY_DN10946_c0_g1~~TRINITY_DN10946_c0_g1_i3.p1  ORF type:complete len:517 (+),score=97.12 TRINITY_DN10946_c0_g1_i3:159-1709(+)